MPEKETLERARRDARAGKAPSTQAGEFIREEIHHIREGKHGARSTGQAIAIGLSKARRAGVDLPAPPPGKTSEKTRKSAKRAYEKGQEGAPVSKRRSRATERALEHEGGQAASSTSLARQTRRAAKKRSAAERKRAARKGAQTKGRAGRRKAARKAAVTRKRRAA